MRIKTFEAPTMQEALLMARNELGEDAVVLNTKHVKAGGLLNLRGATKVELMAAVDDSSMPPAPCAPVIEEPVVAFANTFADTMQTVQAEPVMVMPEVSIPTPVAEKIPTAPSAYAVKQYANVSSPVQNQDGGLQQLRDEVKQLTSIVQRLLGDKAPDMNTDVPLIIKLGVNKECANNYLSDCLDINEPMSLAVALAGRMQQFAQPPVLDKREVIAVVGPTGVGKTTTLAKLAAKFSLEMGKKVALVTADTYRIGAVEQLRTYARIMGVPLEIASTPEEVAAGVAKHSDKDVVLIDTVGRSQRKEEHLAELKSFVDAAQPTQTYLVIAASLSEEIQTEVVENFQVLSPTSLVITKLDESPSRGCLVNLPFSTGLGISCLTAGQNVPQDIDFAEAGKIARLLTEVV